MAFVATAIIIFLSSLSYSLQRDVYEDLWNTNIGIAEDTLNTDFLRQMKNNTLQAERYINFYLQDINYLLQVTNMLKNMSDTVTKPKDLQEFMAGRYTSYKQFLDFLLHQYFLKDAPYIDPTPAMDRYLSTYRKAMVKDPIYFAVALLPCSRLWVWLANNLEISESNVYYTWKKDNMSGRPEKHYKALLNKYLTTKEKIKYAKKLFRMQMQNEHDFFATS